MQIMANPFFSYLAKATIGYGGLVVSLSNVAGKSLRYSFELPAVRIARIITSRQVIRVVDRALLPRKH